LNVAAVTGVPLEHVLAGAEKGGVVTLLAVDEIVWFLIRCTKCGTYNSMDI